MISLNTQNTALCTTQSSDYPELAKLFSNPVVRRHLGGPVSATDIDKKLIALRTSSNNKAFTVRNKTNQRFLGLVTLSPHRDDLGTEISFEFDPDNWGTGTAFESVQAVIEHAFSELLLPQIFAETQAANTRARKLLERLQMRHISDTLRFDSEQVIYELGAAKRPGNPPDLD